MFCSKETSCLQFTGIFTSNSWIYISKFADRWLVCRHQLVFNWIPESIPKAYASLALYTIEPFIEILPHCQLRAYYSSHLIYRTLLQQWAGKPRNSLDICKLREFISSRGLSSYHVCLKANGNSNNISMSSDFDFGISVTSETSLKP